jgi:hypothetical protein
MALTPILDSSAGVSINLEQTLSRPNSVTVVQSSGNPGSDSSWTTTTPKTLYQAPSTCRYAKIYWRKCYTDNLSEGASYFPVSTTAGYYYTLSVTDGTITREIYRGINSTNGGFNLNKLFNTNLNNSVVLQENDTYISNDTSAVGIFVSGDFFTLAPGEKIQLATGNNSFGSNYYANFEVWVYN